MKIRKKSRRLTFIIAGVVLASLAAVCAYAWYAANTNSTPPPDSSDKQTRQESDMPTESTSNLPAKSPSENGESTPDTTSPDDNSEDTPPKAIETPRIERAGQSGSDVKIVASFQKPSDGNCEAKLRNNSREVKRTAPIVLGPAYYSCSFSIPASAFTADGTWELSLSHLRGSSVSTAEIQEVQIRR